MLKATHAVIAAAILYVLAILFGAFPAAAAVSVCGPWELMLRNIYTAYGETPAHIAVTGSGSVITITVNEDTHTFTVLSQSNPDVMCMISAGTDWRAAPEGIKNGPKKPPGKDS